MLKGRQMVHSTNDVRFTLKKEKKKTKTKNKQTLTSQTKGSNFYFTFHGGSLSLIINSKHGTKYSFHIYIFWCLCACLFEHRQENDETGVPHTNQWKFAQIATYTFL